MENKLLLIIISIFLSPLAVFLKVGIGNHFINSIILSFCFYLPGIIHALWISTR
jgi:uncharacterized membrane protein YqaE (UPF0057 family)